MAFSPLPSSLEEALKEIKMWRETFTKQKFTPQPAQKPLTDEQSHQTLLDMAKHIETFGDETTTEQQLSAECLRFILERVAAHGIKE